MDHGARATRRCCGVELVVNKCFSLRIEPIQILVAAYPQIPGAILKQRVNVDTAETRGVAGRVLEDLEPVPVISIQSILRSKPYESTIVLHNLGHARLRQALRSGQPREPQIRSFHNRQPD